MYAGKTMGLAPYGNPNKYKQIKIFNFDKETGKISCNINNHYTNCTYALKEFFKDKYNMKLIEPRTPIDEITQEYAG